MAIYLFLKNPALTAGKQGVWAKREAAVSANPVAWEMSGLGAPQAPVLASMSPSYLKDQV